MRKIGQIVLGIIIGALATYFFCPRQANGEEPVTAKVLLEKPKGVITVEQAKELNDNWTKYRKPLLDSITESKVGKEDFRWAWWSLEDVEKYIAYIKKETEADGEEFTGLRIYLGVYGDMAAETKKDLTTMFIVPTGHKKLDRAGVLNFSLQGGDDNLPKPPLNDGSGGQGEYP